MTLINNRTKKAALMSKAKVKGKTFDDTSEWAKSVLRFVKSATHGGGFVKKSRLEEYKSLADKKNGSILS
jgi:hypothetical protein